MSFEKIPSMLFWVKMMMSQRQGVMLYSFFLLLLSSSYATETNEDITEVQYSPASTLHGHSEKDASSLKVSVTPRHFKLGSLRTMPLVILQPKTPIHLKGMPGENFASLFKSLNTNGLATLMATSKHSNPSVSIASPPEAVMEAYESHQRQQRQPKQMSFAASNPIRYIFGQQRPSLLPRIPSGSSVFSVFSSPPGMGWPQRFKNMFSFGRQTQNPPYAMPTASHTLYLPPAQNGHLGFSPMVQNPRLWNQGDLSQAGSAQLQVGNFFNPYRQVQVPQNYMGGDLLTSGSRFVPHQMTPAAAQNFAQYTSTVPRHVPLFNNVGGLKGTSMEISNAFADFADSHEHGPEVTQKFGSVGHTVNTFLNMMGLGPSGGISADDFGGAGNWASMDSSPIARSLDFYPDYGNQAHLDAMEDLPIFHEDITEEFLKKMNLTEVLEQIRSKKTEDNSESVQYSEFEVGSPQYEPNSEGAAIDLKVNNGETPSYYAGFSMKESFPYLPAETFEFKEGKLVGIKDNQGFQDKQPNINEEVKKEITGNETIEYAKGEKSENKKESMPTQKKKSSMVGGYILSVSKKEPSHQQAGQSKPVDLPTPVYKAKDEPRVNYKIPLSLPTVSPEDKQPPVVVFKSFPAKHSSSDKAPAPPSYAPAVSLPNHETEVNPNKLIDENVLRQWVPYSSGQGYVEKQPKPIIENPDRPKAFEILEQKVTEASKSQSIA